MTAIYVTSKGPKIAFFDATDICKDISSLLARIVSRYPIADEVTGRMLMHTEIASVQKAAEKMLQDNTKRKVK